MQSTCRFVALSYVRMYVYQSACLPVYICIVEVLSLSLSLCMHIYIYMHAFRYTCMSQHPGASGSTEAEAEEEAWRRESQNWGSGAV